MMSGIHLYNNNPRGYALNQTIYVIWMKSLWVQRKESSNASEGIRNASLSSKFWMSSKM